MPLAFCNKIIQHKDIMFRKCYFGVRKLVDTSRQTDKINECGLKFAGVFLFLHVKSKFKKGDERD